MPKHQKNRKNKHSKNREQVAPEKKVKQPSKSIAGVSKMHLLFFFLFGFLLYANTVTFDYALDDKLAITFNDFTKEGFSGIDDIVTNDMLVGFYGKKKNLIAGGRYRPLSMVMYAAEWGLFGRSPEISHFINALFYGLTGVVLYIILCNLFPPDKKRKWYLTFPFIVTALFIAHPLHTEVVANIKSRDEIMNFLLSISTLYFVVQYLNFKKTKHIAYACLCFFLALCSKESAITFVIVIPMAVFYFTKHSLKSNIMAMLPVGATAVVYLLIRHAVVGSSQYDPVPELLNDPYMYATASQKLGTVFFTMGLYLKLLFLPHPLTHDYYPWHPIAPDNYVWDQNNLPYIEMSDPKAFIPLLIFAALLVYALLGIKKKSLISFCILYFLGTFILFSNLFFSIGTFMNERFLYIPSLGFVMIVAYFLVKKLPKYVKGKSYQTALTGILAIVLVAFSFKTFTRNFAWKDDFTLATTDISVSHESAKAGMAAGLALVNDSEKNTNEAQKTQMLNKALGYLTHSLELYPTYIQSQVTLANAYFLLNQFETAFNAYVRALQINPNFNDARKNMEFLGDRAQQEKMYDLSLRSYQELLKTQPNNASIYAKIGEVYGRYLNQPQKSLENLEKAYQLSSQDTDIMQKLGVVYAMQNRTQEALSLFTKASELDPKNGHILLNIGVTYQQLGDQAKADQYIQQAYQVDPSLKK